MRALLLFGLGVLLAFGYTGCAGSDDKKPESEKISTIPWNRPEKWESQGPLGSMMPQNQ